MKIIITESQYKFLSEQTAYEMYLDRTLEDPVKAQAHLDQFKNVDQHTTNTILQIATAFIPYVGPIISTGIGLYDAKLYYDENQKKMAGLVGFFALIPGISGLMGKIGLGNISAKAMSEIGKKIGLGSKLTQGELQVANKVAQYKNLIQTEITKVGEQAAKQTVKTQLVKQAVKQGIKQSVKQGAKTVAGYGAAGAAYSKGYDIVKSSNPKVKAETEGFDWELAKSAFGSSGTLEDNKLLNKAWSKGWRPGSVVPEEFQTQAYKTFYAEEVNNINQLQTLLAQVTK